MAALRRMRWQFTYRNNKVYRNHTYKVTERVPLFRRNCLNFIFMQIKIKKKYTLDRQIACMQSSDIYVISSPQRVRFVSNFRRFPYNNKRTVHKNLFTEWAERWIERKMEKERKKESTEHLRTFRPKTPHIVSVCVCVFLTIAMCIMGTMYVAIKDIWTQTSRLGTSKLLSSQDLYIWRKTNSEK